MSLLEGTTKCVFNFAHTFCNNRVFIKFIFSECWNHRKVAFHSDPILACSEHDLYRGEEQVAALRMERMIRFIFLDPIVVNQHSSLEGKADFPVISEFNILKKHIQLFCRRIIIPLDYLPSVNFCRSVLDLTEQFRHVTSKNFKKLLVRPFFDRLLLIYWCFLGDCRFFRRHAIFRVWYLWT